MRLDDEAFRERLRAVRDALDLRMADFARQIGVPRTTAVGWEEGKVAPIGLLAKLESSFRVNPDWFLSGEGPMFRKEGHCYEPPDSDAVAVRESMAEFQFQKGDDLLATNRDGHGVPYYDVDVAAHFAVETPTSESVHPAFFVDFQPFNDCTAFLPIYGDSMFPMIASGDVVAVKEIKNKSIILWGEAYLVLTSPAADSLRTVKLIHPHEDPAFVNLRASNPNYKGDIPVRRDEIIGLYIVKGIVTRKQM